LEDLEISGKYSFQKQQIKFWIAIKWFRVGSKGSDDDEALGSTKEENT
jgi:hypothetical protein